MKKQILGILAAIGFAIVASSAHAADTAAKPEARFKLLPFGAVRKGDWKLVRLGRSGAWELYDMKADRTISRRRIPPW